MGHICVLCFVSYYSKRCNHSKEFVDLAVGDLIANPSGVDSNQFAETIRRFFLNQSNLLKAIVAFLVMYLPIGMAEVAAGEGALQT